MAQPSLKRRRVNPKPVKVVDKPDHTYHLITDAQREQARKKQSQAVGNHMATSGIKRTGGFGIA